jgi:hypothetical protein
MIRLASERFALSDSRFISGLRTKLSDAESDPELTQLIGIVAARWATLDFFLVQVLGVLLRNDEAAEIVYYSLANLKARLDIITNLTRELVLDKKLQKGLLTLLNRLNRLQDTRNEVIHWMIINATRDSDKHPELMRRELKPGKAPRYRSIPINKHDIAEHADAVTNVAILLLGVAKPWFGEQMIAEIGRLLASPDTPPPLPRGRSRPPRKKPRVLRIKRAHPLGHLVRDSRSVCRLSVIGIAPTHDFRHVDN